MSLHPSPVVAPTPTQLRAITCKHPLGIIAGPGSGKTKVLADSVQHWVAQGWARADQHLLVTYTNRAASEMRARLPADLAEGVWVSTLHSFCLNQLVRPFAAELGYASTPPNAGVRSAKVGVVFGARQRSLVSAAVDTVCAAPGTPDMARDWLRRIELDEIVGTIADFKARGISANHAPASDPLSAARASVYREYQRALRAAHLNDADGLLLDAHTLLQLAEPQAFIRSVFTRVLVDEAQDLSELQWTVIRALAGESPLMIVGDPRQSIYGWRGAIGPEVFNRFKSEIPNAELMLLAENHRSRRPIVSAANALAGCAQMTALGDGAPVSLIVTASEHEQARLVIAQIRRAIDEGGIAPGEIAVLARGHEQLKTLELALVQAHIAYVTPGRGGFWDRTPVRELRAILALALPGAVDLFDNLALRETLAIPGLGLALEAREALRGDAPELVGEHLFDGERLAALSSAEQQQIARWVGWLGVLQAHAESPPAHLIAWVLDCDDGMGYARRLAALPDSAKQRGYIDALLTLASQHKSVESFLDEAALSSGDDPLSPGESDAITLATLHAAKGLEFRAVFLLGLNEGVLPTTSASKSQTGLEEELRALYVGMTRAREVLCLLLTQTRERQTGQIERLTGSRFLHRLHTAGLARQVPNWAALVSA